ncbi:hypothetical protein ARAF_3064 [Arsenophonus endosymbiont of Aleurodicus floccissimus]|nr:hypothetical protein ARAF_3064 [Arsenophonus endosymbiont of Aleurodicus floccissimus]
MLNIKFIPKKALVLTLGGCMLFPNVSLTINNTAPYVGISYSY